MIKTLAVSVLALAGCGLSANFPTIEPTTEVELAITEETYRAAQILGQKVVPRITESRYFVDGQEALGWYSQGAAYYNRAMLEKYVALGPSPYKETARNVAAHEVAHAISAKHDCLHWTSCAKAAAPTYPNPCKQ